MENRIELVWELIKISMNKFLFIIISWKLKHSDESLKFYNTFKNIVLLTKELEPYKDTIMWH